MAEKSRFFNSIDGDRAYSATDWAEYFASFIGNGVFGSPATNLLVSPGNGMSVSIAAGLAWINGYFYVNNAAFTLALSTADGSLPRIDRVVIRWSLANRAITAAVKTGTAASSPSAPTLTRDSSVYELAIADVYIAVQSQFPLPTSPIGAATRCFAERFRASSQKRTPTISLGPRSRACSRFSRVELGQRMQLPLERVWESPRPISVLRQRIIHTDLQQAL